MESNILTSNNPEIKELLLVGVKNILSVKELCVYTGLSRNSIYNLISARKIPHYKSQGGRLTFFKKDEIDNWLCAFRIPTMEESQQQAVEYCAKKGGVK